MDAMRKMTFEMTEVAVAKSVIAIVIVTAVVAVNSISTYDHIYYFLLTAIVTDITAVAAC